MSDPLTLAAVALTAAGGVAGANEAGTRGEEDAKFADRAADTARREAARRAADLQRRNAALLSRQRVRYAKGGIVLSGSPLDLLADAAAESELAARDVVYDGEATATELQLRGNRARRRGETARRQGQLRAGATLLGALR